MLWEGKLRHKQRGSLSKVSHKAQSWVSQGPPISIYCPSVDLVLCGWLLRRSVD